jgi:exopolysaccharide production protein ExoQ
MKNLADRAVLIAWILVASGAGMILYLGPRAQAQATAAGGGTGIQALYGAFYLFFVGMLILSYRTSLSLISEERWIFVLWLWAVASAAWSPMPGMTLRRCVALLGTTGVGLFVATRFEPREQLRIVAHCIGLAALASPLAVLLFPEYSIAQTGEWTGVFYQKNGLGHAMSLGVLCYAFLALSQRRGRLSSIFMAVFCGGLLLMSRSMTAIIVCTMMLVVLRFRKLLLLQARKLIGLAAVFLTVGIPIAIYVIQHAGDVLKAFGRDATLTGRVPLWNTVLDEIPAHPWHGFGYGAFWFTPEGARIQANFGWEITHSHDGYLEVTLALGLIGLALLAMVLVKNLLRGIHVARDGKTIDDFWPLFFLIFAVMDNITESWLLMANSLFWMLFVANSYWLVRRLQPVTVEEDETEPSPEFALGGPMGVDPAES